MFWLANASLPIDCSDLPSSTSLMLARSGDLLLNADLPIAFRLSGSLTLMSLCPSKALSPILSRPSENSTFSRGAPLNAILPTFFTDFGSSSDFRFAPENAACPISVTPSGITTELIGFPPVLAGANAPVPIFLIAVPFTTAGSLRFGFTVRFAFPASDSPVIVSPSVVKSFSFHVVFSFQWAYNFMPSSNF